ncbi:MAG: four helix bundle protein [Eudoraea sp.]|nr:four helix bundle protein [Eudoraea sp.]
MFVHIIHKYRKLDYKQLTVWKKSRELVSILYDMTKDFPEVERFGLIGQIRRAAISVPANIAEGCGRKTNNDTMRFLFIARGSIYELETHLYLALDQAFISSSQFNITDNKVIECRQLLSGFIRYFQNRE